MDACEYNFVKKPRLKELWWEEGMAVRLGHNGVNRIEVILENGEMALAPTWVGVWHDDGRFIKYNLRYVSGIVVLTGNSTDAANTDEAEGIRE